MRVDPQTVPGMTSNYLTSDFKIGYVDYAPSGQQYLGIDEATG